MKAEVCPRQCSAGMHSCGAPKEAQLSCACIYLPIEHRADKVLCRPLGLYHHSSDKYRNKWPAPICPVRLGKPLILRDALYKMLPLPCRAVLCWPDQSICDPLCAWSPLPLAGHQAPAWSQADSAQGWSTSAGAHPCTDKRWCGVYLFSAGKMIPSGEEPFDFAFMLYIDFL